MEERIMDKVTIVFWSQSGNTESMANAVAEGVTAAGKEAVVVDVASASLDDLSCKRFRNGLSCNGSRSARKKARWNHLYAMWKDLQQVRQSLCLALMDGAMDSGCVTG